MNKSRTFDLGNGHTLTVEKAHERTGDVYKVRLFEDGLPLSSEEYADKEYLEWFYEITL